jgi:hypothetical protein
LLWFLYYSSSKNSCTFLNIDENLILLFFFSSLSDNQFELEVEPGIPFIKPATVANSGLSISFDRPCPNSIGTPILAGKPKTSSANSVQPRSKDPPPANTIPALFYFSIACLS